MAPRGSEKQPLLTDARVYLSPRPLLSTLPVPTAANDFAEGRRLMGVLPPVPTIGGNPSTLPSITHRTYRRRNR